MVEKNFAEIIRDMNPEEHARRIQMAEKKNATFTRKLNGKKKVNGILKIAKVLGIGERFFSSGGSGKQEYAGDSSYSHSSPGGRFREQYRVPTPPPSKGFSVYDINEIDIANARDYYKGVDGKGDPEPHDCGHEH